MLSKIGWAIVVLAIVALGGVWFFRKYQIVPRAPSPVGSAAPIANLPAADAVPTSTAAVGVVPITAAIQFISADVSAETASYTIKAFYPAMTGGDEAVRNNFNSAIRTVVDKFVAEFKKAAAAGIALPDAKSMFTWAYDIKEQNDNLVSVLMSGEQYVTGSAHPSHPMVSFSFDLKSGQPVVLSDLFQPKVKFLETLSNYSRRELETRNVKEKFTDEPSIQSGTAAKEEMFAVFNITGAGLALTFPEYQVAPYVAGASVVLVPWAVLSDILEPSGPAGAYLPAAAASTSTPPLIGGQKDEHGCLTGAGYSWCPSTGKCQRMWEEYCAEYKDAYRGSTQP